jgi:hypothetical protein
MLLKIKTTGCLVEVCNLSELTDPCSQYTQVRRLRGYKDAEPTTLKKIDLIFVSGEQLPCCWQKVYPKSSNQVPA